MAKIMTSRRWPRRSDRRLLPGNCFGIRKRFPPPDSHCPTFRAFRRLAGDRLSACRSGKRPRQGGDSCLRLSVYRCSPHAGLEKKCKSYATTYPAGEDRNLLSADEAVEWRSGAPIGSGTAPWRNNFTVVHRRTTTNTRGDCFRRHGLLLFHHADVVVLLRGMPPRVRSAAAVART
jgi:hypothetical protein